MYMSLTRRSFGLAAVGGALLPTLPAAAKVPPAGAQAAGVYRVKVGTVEVTVLNDGSGRCRPNSSPATRLASPS
jgi:hypothetical protein